MNYLILSLLALFAYSDIASPRPLLPPPPSERVLNEIHQRTEKRLAHEKGVLMRTQQFRARIENRWNHELQIVGPPNSHVYYVLVQLQQLESKLHTSIQRLEYSVTKYSQAK